MTEFSVSPSQGNLNFLGPSGLVRRWQYSYQELAINIRQNVVILVSIHSLLSLLYDPDGDLN